MILSKSSKDQKKRSSPKVEEFLPPKSSEGQKKSPKIIQRLNADHSQITVGDAVKLLGGIYPPHWHP